MNVAEVILASGFAIFFVSFGVGIAYAIISSFRNDK